MLICAAGDSHGRLDRMYTMIAEMEAELGRQVDLVVQVGDFGIWPDPDNLDDATRRHNGAGDYPRWHTAGQGPPRPTIFIAGNHEDFSHLHGHNTATELLPGLIFLPWGCATTFEAAGESVTVGGVGGCYSAKSYRAPALPISRRRHYTRHEVRRLVEREGPRLDILMCHDAPAGTLERYGSPNPIRRTANSEGLGELVATVKPRICLTGHWHFRTERIIGGVRTTGLSIVPAPGCLIFMEFTPGEDPVDLLEWGRSDHIEARPTRVETPEVWADPEDMKALTELVKAWAKEMKSEGKMDRDARKRAYKALAGNPLRPVYMSALRDSEVGAALERCVSPDMVPALLEAWQKKEFPPLT